jgi:hypothetical protein
MATLNGRRILGGAVAATLVLLLAQGGAETAFAAAYQQTLERLGGSTPAGADMALLLLFAGALGTAAVWGYALARTVYRPGAPTALGVALVLWSVACLGPNLGLLAYGILTADFFWLASVVDLAAVSLATLAGAWIYRPAPVRQSYGATGVAAG